MNTLVKFTYAHMRVDVRTYPKFVLVNAAVLASLWFGEVSASTTYLSLLLLRWKAWRGPGPLLAFALVTRSSVGSSA